MRYFLDSYALIEIAQGNPKYDKYKEDDSVTLKDNLAELFYFLLRKYGEKTANEVLETFSSIAVELPLDIIAPAMHFKHRNAKTRFSYIDCLGYAFALQSKRLFLTGDRVFTGMENVELVR